MLLFVDDRSMDGPLFSFNEQIHFAMMDELLSLLYGSYGKLTTIHIQVNSYRVHEVGTDSKFDINYDIDDIRAMTSLMDSDPMDICVFARKMIVFEDKIPDITEYHHKDRTGITALVKEGISRDGMRPVFIDSRNRLDYSDNAAIIRSRVVDLGYYIIDKSFMKEFFRRTEGLIGLNKDDMISISGCEAVKGYRVRSRIGFIDDLESILETQRMMLDWMMQDLEKARFGNIDQNNIIVNMPSFIHNTAVIGENCRLGPYTTIMREVKVGKNVFIINSIICEKCIIGDDVYIEGAIIGPGSSIENGSEIEWCVH
ncbi:MAG: NDP-sugar synthase [Candidatus Thermoplasmatota archaeon]|nr:NDP-sugar synthase [Candidatus Thermoplasmatota archaeon]